MNGKSFFYTNINDIISEQYNDFCRLLNNALTQQTHNLSLHSGRGIFKRPSRPKEYLAFCRQSQLSNKIRELICRKTKMEHRIDQLQYEDSQLDDRQSAQNRPG